MFGKYKQIFIRLCFMGVIPLISIIHVMLNVNRGNTYNIKLSVDDIIPFIPAFSLPYLYWFIYVFIGLLFFAFKDNKSFFRLLGSIAVGMGMCFIVFYFFPTTVPRPEVVGDDIFNKAVRFVYMIDNPYNCFPSIHVLNAMLVTMFFCYYSRLLIIRLWSVISCIAIILSTFFIKQHFVLDAAAGMMLSITVFLAFNNENLWGWIPVKKVIGFLTPEREKDTAGIL